MSEPIKLPPMPDTEYTLAVPAAPYEPAWISSMEAWDESAMENYARLAVEQNTATLHAECDALRADAERYRFVRDADRSDCITRELSLYAMESLDEYVDAAMEAAARAALKEAK